MQISAQHTQALIQALSMAAQVAGQKVMAESNRQQMKMALAMFETKAGVMRDLVGALVEKRVDAVRSGFSEVMAMYVEQAHGFLDEKRKLIDAELTATDALQSARLRKRMGEIDIALREIRADAARLYAQMNEVILQLGGGALSLAPEFYNTLDITQPNVMRM